MALTQFGKAVRKARIDTGHTLKTMSEELNISSAFLSGMETGHKKIPKDWVNKITEFFELNGHPIYDLAQLADIANETVSLSGLPKQQQLLLAEFANTKFTSEQLLKFTDLIKEANTKM